MTRLPADSRVSMSVNEWLEVNLFEPRWHGWARWSLIRYWPSSKSIFFCETLEEGWVRRPRGSEYVRVKVNRIGCWPLAQESL